MKNFAYLNTDLISSYLAQLNDGLIESKQAETGTLVTKEKKTEDIPITHGSIMGLNIPGLFKYEHDMKHDYFKEMNAISQTNAGRELISKIIHDNSYDDLVSYLNTEKNIKDYLGPTEYTIGDYVQITGKLRMVDLSVISNIFNNDFKNVYTFLQTNQLNKSIDQLNRPQKRDQSVKKEVSKAKKEVNDDLAAFEDVSGLIKFIANLLPSDKYIIYEDIFIPLNKKYLREDYNSLRYKYSSESQILGHITGTIKGIMDFKPGNELDGVFKSIDVMLLESLKILSIGEDFKIMHPISWYYE